MEQFQTVFTGEVSPGNFVLVAETGILGAVGSALGASEGGPTAPDSGGHP